MTKYCVYCGKRNWKWQQQYEGYHINCWNKHEYEQIDKPVRMIFMRLP